MYLLPTTRGRRRRRYLRKVKYGEPLGARTALCRKTTTTTERYPLEPVQNRLITERALAGD